MADLMNYLKFAVDNGASDVLIVAGGPVHAKIDGRIRPVDDEPLSGRAGGKLRDFLSPGPLPYSGDPFSAG